MTGADDRELQVPRWMPEPPPRVRQAATRALETGVALMAFVSLNPYFMWGHQKPWYAVATAIVVLSGALGCRTLDLSRGRIVLALGFALFLVYLTALPKVGGGITRWFLLIPFAAAVIFLRRENLRTTFDIFHWMFALSLIPGMAAWLWSVSGLPVTGWYTTPPAEIVQRGVIDYLELPGAVFILSNALVLPNGGTLFRLCGVLDEPGTVGTIAALCLAATRFRLRSVPGAISFAAGIMSLSMAFVILTAIGMFVIFVMSRQWLLLAGTCLCLGLGAFVLSGPKSADGAVSNVEIIVRNAANAATAPVPPAARDALPASGDATRGRFTPVPEWTLRNAPRLLNREERGMRELLERYRTGSPGTLLFGIASDASIVYAPGSSVWYRVLTDFGLLGLLALPILFGLPLMREWRYGALDASALLFVLLFAMSFYQRPIIWLPAQLLIYLAGVCRSGGPGRHPAPPDSCRPR